MRLLILFRACPNLLESYLRRAIREIREQERVSAVRLDRIDSLNVADSDRWRQVRKSLERNGFTLSILQQHKAEIVQSLKFALAKDAVRQPMALSLQPSRGERSIPSTRKLWFGSPLQRIRQAAVNVRSLMRDLRGKTMSPSSPNISRPIVRELDFVEPQNETVNAIDPENSWSLSNQLFLQDISNAGAIEAQHRGSSDPLACPSFIHTTILHPLELDSHSRAELPALEEWCSELRGDAIDLLSRQSSDLCELGRFSLYHILLAMN